MPSTKCIVKSCKLGAYECGYCQYHYYMFKGLFDESKVEGYQHKTSHKKRCKKCKYYCKNTKSCDYIIIEYEPRPCPADEHCTCFVRATDTTQSIGDDFYEEDILQEMSEEDRGY